MVDTSKRVGLFPAFEPYQTGMLKVSDIHTIYWGSVVTPRVSQSWYSMVALEEAPVLSTVSSSIRRYIR